MNFGRPHFVDSNLFVYAFDAAEPAKMERAREVVNYVAQRQEGFISTQVLNETFSNLIKPTKAAMSRDEARIANQGGNRIGDGVVRQVAGIGPFVHRDARVVPQLPGKLAVTDIDRVHLCRAMRQQDIGEAAGGCTDIEADAAGRREAEMTQRVVELPPAA